VTIFVSSRSSSDLTGAAGTDLILTETISEEGGIFTSTGMISTAVNHSAGSGPAVKLQPNKSASVQSGGFLLPNKGRPNI
jgi:hypothetical protein